MVVLFLASMMIGGFVSPMAAAVFACINAGSWIISRENRLSIVEQNSFQECRISVSKLLGSMGARPLLPTETVCSTEYAPVHYTVILEFSQSYIALLVEMDRLFNVLRTAVGLHLGTASRSVERVELASTRRGEIRGGNALVVLPTIRRMLLCVMMDHYRSLQTLCAEVSSIPGEADDDMIEAPSVITLQWLKQLRQELAELLSMLLSRLLLSPCVLRDLSLAGSDMEGRLHTCTMTANESQQYLSSMCVLPVPESTDKLQQDLNSLCRHLDSASVALWACQVSLDNEDKEEILSNVRDFLEQFDILLNSAGDAKEALKEQLACNDVEGMEMAENLETMELEDSLAGTEAEDYEHSGVSFMEDSLSRNPENAIPKNKTVVFSATGSVKKSISSTGKTPMMREHTATIPHQSVATQRTLLQELQKRLEKMDRLEEVDSNGGLLDELEAPTRKQEKEPSASLMFLGASGDLLKELKQSMDNVDDC